MGMAPMSDESDAWPALVILIVVVLFMISGRCS